MRINFGALPPSLWNFGNKSVLILTFFNTSITLLVTVFKLLVAKS